jgi:DNA modification methylase
MSGLNLDTIECADVMDYLRGLPDAGVVMDIFMGAGTVGLVAKKLNRRYIGCDLNADYVRMAQDRINGISYTLFSLMEVTGD